MRLKDKVAIVTGSSKGIGAAIVKALAKEGARVVVNYLHSRAAGEAVLAEIVSKGGDGIVVKSDVGNSAEARSLFDAAMEAFGKVDVVVNNAGIALYKRLQDTSDSEFDRCFDINVKGVFYMLREAATRLEAGGRIVNVSSSVTRLMMPTYGTYSATKAAVEQLTRIFAREVGPRGITVNSISPGPTNTELFTRGKAEETIRQLAGMTALGRIGEPEDIARVVLFLVSDEAAWVTGQNLGANGGFA